MHTTARLAPLALVALPLLTAGCASLSSPPESSPPLNDFKVLAQDAPTQPLQTPDARAQYHIMAGEMAAGRNEPELAAREFLAALENVDDVELARRATALALLARNEELTLSAARRWLVLEPTAADPREVIAGFSLRRGELEATLEQAQALVAGHPAGPSDGLRHVAQLLAQTSSDRAEAAITIMHQLVAQHPDLAGAHHALAMLALRFDRLPLAETAARRAQELEPDNRDHALLMVGVWVRQDRIEEADARVAALARQDPAPADLHMGYAKLLLESGQREAARRQLEQVLRIDRRNDDARYGLGVLAFNDGDHETAERHFRQLLEGPRQHDAALQLGRIAEAQQRYPQALEYYGRIAHGTAALDAAVRRAYVLSRMDRMDEARQLLTDLRSIYPQLATRFFLAEGELLVNSGRNQDALDLYNAALADDADNHDLLYGRSLAYERLGEVALAEKDLRVILGAQPEDARALNALGYMLTVHTPRLQEAETLLKRAIEIEPDDAAIIDSMGWLQYKLGKPAEALTWLKKAYAQFPDPEVAAHLGEVLWVLDEREQAEAIWSAALRNNPDHPVLLETIHRLKP